VRVVVTDLRVTLMTCELGVRVKKTEKRKKPKGTSPNARTCALFRSWGWDVGTVEQWIPRINVRRDLYGFLDQMGFHEHLPGVLGIQSTTGDHVSDRLTKALALPQLARYLSDPSRRFVVIGWAKAGKVEERKLWKWRMVFVKRTSQGELVTDTFHAGGGTLPAVMPLGSTQKTSGAP